MQSRDFCFWLQGFFEITNPEPENLTKVQVQNIKKHLNMVFKHEIDSSMPDPTGELTEIHNGLPNHLNPNFPYPEGERPRC